MPKENRQYKDSVFTDLFYSDETAAQNLLSLYNAIYGTDYRDPGIVEKCRLEDVIFMNFKNDAAALFGRRRLFLSEHQSTVNENMPLRMLLYAAREYEKLTEKENRYRRTVVEIPTPEFVAFYNGTDAFPSEKVYRLSDAFMEKTETPELELTVRMININEKKGHGLLRKCPVLLEYSRFVEIVRECREADSENGLRDAVEQCIREGILSEYLSRKASEVINMLTAEYNYQEDIAANRDEAYSIGNAKGRAEGLAKGFAKGRAEGRAEAFAEMVRDGRLSAEDGARYCGMNLEEFCQKVHEKS